ncbi:MAG: GAF domain-containing sensor histidine kinase, partial [Chloroflexota bacterium]|nr:GAF domain-containing sensor histidine kinase [Chloroflexota bacterium]
AQHPAAIAIRTGQPVINAATSAASMEVVGQDAAQRGTACGMIAPAHVIIPLVAREHVLGAIAFGWNASDRGYDAAELQLAEEIARRAALAVDHARLYRAAQDALRMRDEFVSIAAHELKTPLTTLRGSAELLQRRATQAQPYTLSDRDQRMLRVIEQQSRRLQQQIDTLLDLSHIQAGHLSLNPRPMDLCHLVGRVVDDIQPTLEQHEVTFSCEDSPVIVHADELRLEQVLQNLLQNAVKYSPDGRAITVRVTQQGTEAHIAVSDQGIGIPPEARARVFERFYRAPNAAGAGSKGLGIGLAVVADIVTRHGGRVEVTSAEGQGSTFTVCLPVYEPQLDPGAPSMDN